MSASKYIIIRVTNHQIFFNEGLSIPLSSTNLPYGEFKFVENRTIFWQVEMVQYDKTNARLTVRIINYRPAKWEEFRQQKPKADIKNLSFLDIFWPAINADLSFYKKSSFLPLLANEMPVLPDSEDVLLHLNVKVPFNKVNFGMGFVEWQQKFLWSTELQGVRIYNPHILPEFEYIKTFFSKHFNSKTFDVLMVVNRSGRVAQKVTATSKQIEDIRDIAIETLRFVKVENLRKPSRFIKDIDKTLFTADDIFDNLEKNDLGTFPMTNQELFDQIMTWKDIRNKKQLEYLAGSLHDLDGKIRFTMTPKFGFLFFVKGNQMVHYIWEMLNTNATYIWSFDPVLWSLDRQLNKMEEVISYIRNHGRDTYLRNISPKEEILFRRILHNGANSQLVDYFPKWRNLVNESIV